MRVVGDTEFADIVRRSNGQRTFEGIKFVLMHASAMHVDEDVWRCPYEQQCGDHRGLSDTKRLVDTSGVLNVAAKYTALRGRREKRALGRDEAAGWALTHDVIKHSDGLEDPLVVISSAAEVGVEGCKVNDCSKVDNQWRASRQDEPR
jgi:hypothetical protein